MHGGLLVITFCLSGSLSVIGQKVVVFYLGTSLLEVWSIRSVGRSRWSAHFPQIGGVTWSARFVTRAGRLTSMWDDISFEDVGWSKWKKDERFLVDWNWHMTRFHERSLIFTILIRTVFHECSRSLTAFGKGFMVFDHQKFAVTSRTIKYHERLWNTKSPN